MDKCREAFEKKFPIHAHWIEFDEKRNKYYCPYVADAKASEYQEMWEVWQSRQAEVDQQKLLTRDSELHLDAAKEEIERLKGVVDKALNLINNWWHPNVDQKLFVEALGRALRGEHE